MTMQLGDREATRCDRPAPGVCSVVVVCAQLRPARWTRAVAAGASAGVGGAARERSMGGCIVARIPVRPEVTWVGRAARGLQQNGQPHVETPSRRFKACVLG